MFANWWLFLNEKWTPKIFNTIPNILRSLSLAQSVLKGQNAPIWRSGNRRVKLHLISIFLALSQLVTCVTSPGILHDLESANGSPIWPLISDGCLTDWTVKILPRGDSGQVRFSYESFAFVDAEESPVNIQCRLIICENKSDCPTLKACHS